MAEAVIARGRTAEREYSEAERVRREREAWKRAPVGTPTPGAE